MECNLMEINANLKFSESLAYPAKQHVSRAGFAKGRRDDKSA